MKSYLSLDQREREYLLSRLMKDIQLKEKRGKDIDFLYGFYRKILTYDRDNR